jgi:dTDP-4-amino-4,6-dideoxygalactose transaminase
MHIKIDQLEAKMMEEMLNQIKEIAKQKKKINDMLKEIFNKWKGTHLQKNSKTKKQHSSRWTIMIYLSQHFWAKFSRPFTM